MKIGLHCVWENYEVTTPTCMLNLCNTFRETSVSEFRKCKCILLIWGLGYDFIVLNCSQLTISTNNGKFKIAIEKDNPPCYPPI